jgi:hypothetical protein
VTAREATLQGLTLAAVEQAGGCTFGMVSDALNDPQLDADLGLGEVTTVEVVRCLKWLVDADRLVFIPSGPEPLYILDYDLNEETN